MVVILRAMLDMLIRVFQKLFPIRREYGVTYMRFDLRKTSVTEMLSALRNQTPGRNEGLAEAETLSYDGTMLIRHNCVLPLNRK
jgi:hypothetical protein